mmetsp:Transcript_32137/g.89985  ORF Transcript_32137/g.89985 Transcript_32137/m.89985 type:complete len:218 (+) Transcript_32137:797-1450(+)
MVLRGWNVRRQHSGSCMRSSCRPATASAKILAGRIPRATCIMDRHSRLRTCMLPARKSRTPSLRLKITISSCARPTPATGSAKPRRTRARILVATAPYCGRAAAATGTCGWKTFGLRRSRSGMLWGRRVSIPHALGSLCRIGLPLIFKPGHYRPVRRRLMKPNSGESGPSARRVLSLPVSYGSSTNARRGGWVRTRRATSAGLRRTVWQPLERAGAT